MRDIAAPKKAIPIYGRLVYGNGRGGAAQGDVQDSSLGHRLDRHFVGEAMHGVCYMANAARDNEEACAFAVGRKCCVVRVTVEAAVGKRLEERVSHK
jgi:hypothetical protein